MRRYTEVTVKLWPQYNLLVGLTNLAFWSPLVIYWVHPVIFPLLQSIMGVGCLYWGVAGIIHHHKQNKAHKRLQACQKPSSPPTTTSGTQT